MTEEPKWFYGVAKKGTHYHYVVSDNGVAMGTLCGIACARVLTKIPPELEGRECGMCRREREKEKQQMTEEPKVLSPEEMAAIEAYQSDAPAYRRGGLIDRLLATIKAYQTALEDALEYADHAPGCSGGVKSGAGISYRCKCGLNNWEKEAKKLLGEEAPDAG